MSKYKFLKMKLRFILLLSFILITSISFAQDDDNLKGELVIKKEAKIELGPVNRNFEKINNIQPSQPHKPLEYKAQEVELLLPKLDTKVKVRPLGEETISKLYGDYLKLGFGNYTTPYIEAFFNNKRDEK